MRSEIINVDEIEEIIIAYANGELHKRLEISEAGDNRDTIIAGINMLGEELEKTTISRDYFMSIYNSVSEMLIILDLEGKIQDLNFATETVFCKTLKDLKDINIKSLISERFIHLQNIIQESFNAGEVYFPFEAALIVDSEIEIPVSCSLSKIIDRFNNHRGYLFIAKDITEQKNKEKNELRIAISSQENERKRLANDLHDSLAQEIYAIKIYIDSLLVMDPASKTYKETFETCKIIIDNSLETIRNISFGLMPKALEHSGLIQALNELVSNLKKICRIDYNFPEIHLNIDKESQINIYRIVQEFIGNSLKHTKNSYIYMQLTCKNKTINLIIKDNGIGFNMDNLNYGNGIFNMKSRLKALNADYHYSSEINKGTYLELNVFEK